MKRDKVKPKGQDSVAFDWPDMRVRCKTSLFGSISCWKSAFAVAWASLWLSPQHAKHARRSHLGLPLLADAHPACIFFFSLNRGPSLEILGVMPNPPRPVFALLSHALQGQSGARRRWRTRRGIRGQIVMSFFLVSDIGADTPHLNRAG